MPESRPEDALGTLVKLQNCANCTKYLTLLHIVRYLPEETQQTGQIGQTGEAELTEPNIVQKYPQKWKN